MKKNYHFFLLLIIMAGSSDLSGQDWPQFRGAGRDSRVTGFVAPAQWPAQLSQVWKINVGSGDASPILVGKYIYLNTRKMDNELILCLDAVTGKEIWKTSYPAEPVTGPSGSHPGPRGTPAFAEGKIITFGATGITHCVDAATGKVLWKKDNPSNAVPQFFTGMSPLIEDGLCILHIGTKDKGAVLALDLNTGAEKWKWSGDGPSYASPSIMIVDGQKHVVIHTEYNLISLNLTDGKLIWKVATPVQQRFYNCTSPVINGRTIYFTGAGTGTKAIEIVKEGSNYVPRELWSNTTTGAKWTTPVLKDGFIYGFTDQRRIYCISASNGQTAWIDNAVNSDFATIVDCGNVLFGFPSTGNLIALKPDPKGYAEIAKYKVSETTVFAFPIIAGNTVYIKEAESLILYRIN